MKDKRDRKEAKKALFKRAVIYKKLVKAGKPIEVQLNLPEQHRSEPRPAFRNMIDSAIERNMFLR